MIAEELKQEIYDWMPNKPKNWREGQAVFNYVDQVYGQQEMLNLVTM